MSKEPKENSFFFVLSNGSYFSQSEKLIKPSEIQRKVIFLWFFACLFVPLQMNMKRIGVIAIILTLLPAKMLAQTEGNNGVLLGGSSATSSYAPNDILQSDTLKLHLDPQFTTPLQMKEPSYGQHNDFIESSKMGLRLELRGRRTTCPD